jgi:hypothetical protein
MLTAFVPSGGPIGVLIGLYGGAGLIANEKVGGEPNFSWKWPPTVLTRKLLKDTLAGAP